MSPEGDLGRAFWEKVYANINSRGSATIDADVLTKVWIVPDKVRIYEHTKGAFVVGSHLKVMMEDEYTKEEGRGTKDDFSSFIQATAPRRGSGLPYSIVLKQIILPSIEKEVNEGKAFSNLRQIFNSVILASWYKKALQKSLLAKVYVDQNKTSGIELKDKNKIRKIYNDYLQVFRKGIFNTIKEEYDPGSQEIVHRKYFSGGVNAKIEDNAMDIGKGREYADEAISEFGKGFVMTADIYHEDHSQNKNSSGENKRKARDVKSDEKLEDRATLFLTEHEMGLRNKIMIGLLSKRLFKTYQEVKSTYQNESIPLTIYLNADTGHLEFDKPQDTRGLYPFILTSEFSKAQAELGKIFKFKEDLQIPKPLRRIIRSAVEWINGISKQLAKVSTFDPSNEEAWKEIQDITRSNWAMFENKMIPPSLEEVETEKLMENITKLATEQYKEIYNSSKTIDLSHSIEMFGALDKDGNIIEVAKWSEETLKKKMEREGRSFDGKEYFIFKYLYHFEEILSHDGIELISKKYELVTDLEKLKMPSESVRMPKRVFEDINKPLTKFTQESQLASQEKTKHLKEINIGGGGNGGAYSSSFVNEIMVKAGKCYYNFFAINGNIYLEVYNLEKNELLDPAGKKKFILVPLNKGFSVGSEKGEYINLLKNSWLDGLHFSIFINEKDPQTHTFKYTLKDERSFQGISLEEWAEEDNADLGGIDLNPALARMDIQGDGKGVQFDFSGVDAASFSHTGNIFSPRIIRVVPVNKANLPLLLGLKK